jgi:OmpA family
MPNPPTLRVGPLTLLLVSSDDIERWSADFAADRLRAAAGEWPAREEILRLSASLFGPEFDVDRAIAFLGDAFEKGRLLAVALPGERRGRPRVHACDLDWDDLTNLSDLARQIDDTHPSAEISTPTAARPTSSPPSGTTDGPSVGPPTTGATPEPSFDALVFTCDRFGLESAVVRPGFPTLPDGVREAPTGIGELSQILGYLRAHPEHRVVVVGHADESGKASYNDTLSRHRADCVTALVQGRREDFVAVCETAADLVDLKHALAWAQRRFGWPCDTGERSGIYGPKTKQALPEFRAGASALLGVATPSGGAFDGPPRADDWGLVFALMRLAIAEDLDCTAEELDAISARVGGQTHVVTAAGEHWPRHALAHLQLPDTQERRVEVLVFRPDATIPALAQGAHADEIYAPDAGVTLRYVPPAPRTFLTVTMRDRSGDPCPAVAFAWHSEHGTVRRGFTDVLGRARLDDVPAGAFTVTCIDELDVRAKIWAQRLARAVDAADLAMIHRVLGQSPALVTTILDAYDGPIRGCGPGTALDHLRGIVRSTPAEHTLESLIARAGLASPIRFCFPTDGADGTGR